MLELIERVTPRASHFYKPFFSVYVYGLTLMHDKGVDYWVTRGPQTWPEQTTLWCQGRTSPGIIVTDAMGGDSSHNYGIANDVARDADTKVPKLQPSWKKQDYTYYGETMTDLGLSWGGYFPKFDGPHAQWPEYESKKEIATLKAIYLKHRSARDELTGLRKVWAYLDEQRATDAWKKRNPRLAATLRSLGYEEGVPATVQLPATGS